MVKGRKIWKSNVHLTASYENMLPLVLNAIGAAIGNPLWPFDIGDVEAEK